ncbi:MAG: serine/threonine-protein kinase, partial [Gemmatimonadales bacterium]
ALYHPHIVQLYDSGALEGHGRESGLFYVMPYLKGQSLRERLQKDGQLPPEDAVHIAVQVAEALAYAHGRGVVHRDIKPENILLEGGLAFVTDFGIARALEASAGEKLTQSGIVLGTPTYMSPEQAVAGGAADGRSDIYGLGCVLYEMLAGEPPFSGRTTQTILARHASDPVPPLRTVCPNLSPHIEQAVLRALAKAPGDRFATATDFAAALA